MKRILLTAFAGTLLLASCSDSKKKDEDKKDNSTKTETSDSNEAWVAIDSATLMSNMMTYGTPGEMHKMLASWDGTWTGETTMWDYEGAQPQKSTGTAVNSMIMGGKYQMSKNTGDMMGMPFEGMSITAYDNADKKFHSTWIDTWSTGIMYMLGDWDAANKTMTLGGSYPDIHRPGKECHMRQVVKVIDDNTQLMEMYGPDQKTGKEYKIMEMKMTRKK
jgi:Protein of unknown function (DUF1579)